MSRWSRFALALVIALAGLVPLRPEPVAADPATGGILYALQDEAIGTTIHRFRVNEATGALTRIGTATPTGSAGSSSLSNQLLAYEPINHRLYVLSDGADNVRVYQANPFDGSLTEAFSTPINLGAANWRCLAVHRDVLVVGGDSAGTQILSSFKLTATTANPQGTVSTGTAQPFSCRFSNDGGRVYAGGYSNATMAGFSVSASGGLAALAGSPFVTGLSAPAGYAMTPGGQILAAGFNDGNIRAFNLDGSVYGTPPHSNATISGVAGPYDGVYHPGGFYYYTGSTNNFIGGSRFRPNPAGVIWEVILSLPLSTGGNAPRGLVLNQTGGLLFVANSLSRNISTFAVHSGTGALTAAGVQPANTLGTAGAITGIAYAPPPPANGGLLFALQDKGSGNAIHRFRVDEATGALFPLGAPVPTGGSGASSSNTYHLAYAPGSSRLFALNSPGAGTASVSFFSVNHTTGAVTPESFGIILPGPASCVLVHPSGSPVIVAGLGGNRLDSWQVTATGVSAAPVTTIAAGVETGTPAACALSPDGNYFYTRATPASAIAAFAVNAATGALTPLAGSPFEFGLTTARAVAVDRNGVLFLFDAIAGIARAFPTSNGAPQGPGVSVAAPNAGSHGLPLRNGVYLTTPGGFASDVAGYRAVGNPPASMNTTGTISGLGAGAGALVANAAEAFVFIGHQGKRNITIFRHDEAAGIPLPVTALLPDILGVAGSVTGLAYAPQPPGPNGGLVYALSSGAPNLIHRFRADNTTGALTPVGNPVNAGGNTTTNDALRTQLLSYDPRNHRLFALNLDSGTVGAFAINPLTGGLSPLPYHPIAVPDGLFTNNLCVAVHPSGRFLMVGSFDTPLFIYRAQVFAVTDSTATPVGGPVAIDNGARPFSCAYSQDGAYLYTGGENGNRIAGFEVNQSTGTLTALAGSPFTSADPEPRALAADSSGRLFAGHFDTSNPFDPNFDPKSVVRVYTTPGGAPTNATNLRLGNIEARAGLLNPHGYYVVAGGSQPFSSQFRDGVAVVKVGGSGSGTTLSTAPGLVFDSLGRGTTALAQNRTGSIIFAASRESKTIASLALDPATGYLTPISRLPDGISAGPLESMVAVPPPSDLNITLSHAANFVIGQASTVVARVQNAASAAPASGPIEVTFTIPAALNNPLVSGTGWTCFPGAGTVHCTHAAAPDGLAPGASLPDLTLTVDVPGPAGTVTVTAAVNANGEFPKTNNNATGTIAIGAGQTITFPPLPDRGLESSPFTVTASASSGLPVGFGSSTPAVCTVGGGMVTLVMTGTCSIVASQPGNASFAPATPVTRTFTVNLGNRLQFVSGVVKEYALER